MPGASPVEILMVGTAMLLMGVVVAFPAGRICSRLGFSPWLGLFAVVPIANVVLLFFVAFSRWPSCLGADPER